MDDMSGGGGGGVGYACDRVNAPTQVALERGGIKDGASERDRERVRVTVQKGRIDAET